MTARATARRRVAFVRYIGRFCRRQKDFSAAAIAALVSALVVIGFLALSGASLSADQLRARDFGSFEKFAGYGAIQLSPGESAVTTAIDRALSRHGVDEYMVSLTAPEIAASDLPTETARFQEASWAEEPFPERFTDLVGRWPSSPGEVVVTGSTGTEVGAELSVAGDSATLIVVGTADDLYSEQPALLAGPGNWESLPSSLQEAFVTLTAQPTVYWTGSESGPVLEAIERVFLEHRGQATAASVRDTVRQSYDARGPDNTRSTDWVESLPSGFYVPSLLLPCLAVALTFGWAHRRLDRLKTVSSAVGLRPHALLGARCLAMSAFLILGILPGALAGWIVAQLMTPILEGALDQPVDLQVSLLTPLALLVSVTLAASLLATVLVVRRGYRGAASPKHDPPQVQARRPVRPPRRLGAAQVRRLLALLGGCLAVLQVPMVKTAGDSTLLATTLAVSVLLMTPDLLARGLTLLPARSWPARLATKRIQLDSHRSSALVVVTASTLALAIGFLTLLDSLLSTSINERRPEVGRGQALVVNRASNLFSPDTESVEIVRSTLSSSRAIPLVWTLELRPNGNVVQSATIEGTIKSLLVLQSTEDVEAVLGRQLNADEIDVLSEDGVLVWAGEDTSLNGEDSGTLDLSISTSRGQEVANTVSVHSSQTQLTSWQYSTAGVMLRASAAEQGLPLTEGAILFDDVSEEAATELRTTVSQVGIDPETVLTYEAPPPVVPQGALSIVSVGLCLVVFLLASAATWADSRNLRTLTSLLLALGVSPRQARRVVILQHAWLLVIGCVLGIVVAIPATVASATLLPNLLVSVPWAQTGALAGAVILGSLAASVLAMIRLRTSYRMIVEDV